MNTEKLVKKVNKHDDDIVKVHEQLDKKALQSDLIIERNRINNIIKNEGTSVDDLELQDIRNGADGSIYESAGDAVREQNKKIFNYIKLVDDQLKIDIFDGVWKQGYIKETTGAITSTTTNLSTNQYLSYSGAKYEISLNEQIPWICVFFYNGIEAIPSSKKEVSNIDYLQFEIPTNCDRFAISIGMSSEVTPSTMISFYIYDRNNYKLNEKVNMSDLDILAKYGDIAKISAKQLIVDIFNGVWKQGYINKDNGLVVESLYNLTTEQYGCNSKEVYEVNLEEKISWIGIYFYKVDESVPFYNIEGTNTNSIYFEIPEGAVNFAVSVATGEEITPSTMTAFRIANRNNYKDLITEELNIFDNKFVQGYIHESTGNIINYNKNLTSSNYIYCKYNEKYKFRSDDVLLTWFCVYYYNSTSKIPIAKYEIRDINNATFIIPENVTRFKFCIATSYDITPTSCPVISINYESNKLSYLYNKKQNNFELIDKQDLTMPFSIPIHIKTIYDRSEITDGDWRKGGVGYGYDVIYNEKDEKYYMAYSCYSGAETSIGMATSTDMINWTEYSNNPILPPTHNVGDLDCGGLTFPQFLRYDNKWIMYYVGFDEVGFETGLHTICYAESTDLINWTRKGKVVGLEIFTDNNIPMGVIYRPRVRNYFGRYYMFINAGEDDASHGGASESIYVLVSDNPLKDWKYMGKAVDSEVVFADYEYKICSDPDVIYNGKEFIMAYWSYQGVHFMKSSNTEFPLKWNPVDDYFCGGLGRPVFIPTKEALYILCNRGGTGATVSLQKSDWL